MTQPERKEQHSGDVPDEGSLIEDVREEIDEVQKEGDGVRESVMKKASEVSERYRPALDRLAE